MSHRSGMKQEWYSSIANDQHTTHTNKIQSTSPVSGYLKRGTLKDRKKLNRQKRRNAALNYILNKQRNYNHDNQRRINKWAEGFNQGVQREVEKINAKREFNRINSKDQKAKT